MEASDSRKDSSWGNLLVEMREWLKNPDAFEMPLVTGFSELDRCRTMLTPGNLVVLAGRPSMGKTSLALNIIENVALGGHAATTGRPVGLFSATHSARQVAMRIACGRARVNLFAINQGFVSQINSARLGKALDELELARIHVDDAPLLDVCELRVRAESMCRDHQVELIVVDCLQSLKARDHSGEGRKGELETIPIQLKAMARDLDIPVILLVNIGLGPERRGGEERPQLSDLDEFGPLAQVADVVLFLRRPCRAIDSCERDDRNLAIIEVAKDRYGLSLYEIRMRFDDHVARFSDAGQIPLGLSPW